VHFIFYFPKAPLSFSKRRIFFFAAYRNVLHLENFVSSFYKNLNFTKKSAYLRLFSSFFT